MMLEIFFSYVIYLDSCIVVQRGKLHVDIQWIQYLYTF